MTDLYKITTCIGCHSAPLLPLMDFGTPYMNDFVDLKTTLRESVRKFPLKLVICERCQLVQLENHAPADWSFREYWYRSGITQTMRDHLKEIVEKAQEVVPLNAGDAVLDIGANDGTMLRYYPKAVKRVGFEPALNLTEMAEEGGNVIFPDYFGMRHLSDKFKIITAISMFYDVSSPSRFLDDVAKHLTPDGVFIVQMNYLKSMLEQNAFDNVGHEHLAYYSLSTLKLMLTSAMLYPVRVETNDLNGGSLRVYCRKATFWKYGESISGQIDAERAAGLDKMETYTKFTDTLSGIRDAVRNYVQNIISRGRKVYVYGASTRGSTTMQYFDIPGLEYAVERDPRKIGRFTSGTWLKIVDEPTGRREADVFLVLPWHFKKEIIQREEEFLKSGGELIFPMPTPHVVAWVERPVEKYLDIKSLTQMTNMYQTVTGGTE